MEEGDDILMRLRRCREAKAPFSVEPRGSFGECLSLDPVYFGAGAGMPRACSRRFFA